MRTVCQILAAATLLLSPWLYADGDDDTVDAAILEEITAAIQKNVPQLTVDSLRKTPVEGLFEMITDGQIYYVNRDGSYLLDGSLIELSTRMNLTVQRQSTMHWAMLQELGEDNMLVYPSEENSGRSITVFTDITCGYCRKLHMELDELLEGGVAVRYLMFPRSGLGSKAADDLVSVWCADDPQDAMTNAKSGGEIEARECETPIEEHVALAQKFGLRGTPLIYLDSGQRIAGYKPAKELIKLINDSEPM